MSAADLVVRPAEADAVQQEDLEDQIQQEQWAKMTITDLQAKMKEHGIPDLLFASGKNKGKIHNNKSRTLAHCLKWVRNNEKKNNEEVKDEEVKEDEPAGIKSKNKKTTDTILKLVDKLHNIMRSNDAKYGKDAYNDIIRLLFLRFIQPFLDGGLSSLRDSKHYNHNQIGDFEDGWLSLLDFSELATGDKQKLTNEGYEAELYKLYDMLSYHPYTKDIFKKKKSFNCKGSTLRECINAINTDIQKLEFSELDDDVMGIIHEYFVNKYANAKDKEFGQFFTPRELLGTIFQLNKVLFPGFAPNSCYEPCMGTAGFLVEMYKTLKENNTAPDNKNFHAVELDPDAYVIGMMNLLLTFKPLEKESSIADIKRGSSLLNNVNETYDWIATNPPFSVEVDYKKLVGDAKAGNDTAMYGSDDIKAGRAVELKSMYPVASNKNDGFTCFLQHCISKLSIGGVCNIVLPDGRFFGGNGKLQDCRRYLMERCTLRAVMTVPSGVFTHAGVSTAVLCFQGANGTRENPATEEVQFYNATSIKVGKARKVTGYEHLGNVPFAEIVKQNCSLNYQTYWVEELPQYDNVEWKTLGELCEIKNGKTITKSQLKEGVIPVIGGGKYAIVGYHNVHNVDEKTIIISKDGAYAGFVSMFDYKVLVSNHGLYLDNVTGINNHYLYYYLITIQEQIYSIQKGSAQPGVDKNDLSRIQIPVPSLEVQQRVVDICAMVEENKTMAQKMIQNTKNIIKDYCARHITMPMHKGEFETKTLGEVCEFKPKSKRQASYGGCNGRYSFYTSSQTKILKCDTADYKELCLIIGNGGNANVNIDSDFSCSDHNFVIEIKNQNTKFLYYYLLSNIHVLQNCFTGSSIKNISKSDLIKIKIPVPPLEGQRRIVQDLEELYSNIKKYQSTVDQYMKIIKNAMKF
jgi:type I restriction-modification system DNA methylase subunit/restriction endonuclease S subunit